MKAAWRHIKAIFLLPAMAAIVVPAGIIAFTELTDIIDSGWLLAFPFSLIPLVPGCFFILLGLLLWLKTNLLFARKGKGTLAPWDPPKNLVVAGPYRFVRNPMISGVLSLLLGETLVFGSWPILVFFCLFFMANHFFFIKVEEPKLIERFGHDFRQYMKHVPRWIPHAKSWDLKP